ncbi:MAG: carboxypeptidase regulatory-like domain-containing protein [Alphaproteobacteria bacterium]|nr:carboxypeptidase regulatory-like domain-containing protein [Alphaproteobacteria bacterium]
MRTLTLTSLLALPLALGLLACGDKDGDSGGTDGSTDTDGGDTDTDGGDTDTDGGDTDTDTDGGGGGTASISGKVVDPSGGGVEGVQMRLCAELCTTVSTGSDGSFAYNNVSADHYALEAVYLADQKSYATPLDLISIADGDAISLEQDMILYPFATSSDVSSGESLVDVDGSLSIFVDADKMTGSTANSPYLDDGESEYLAAVRVDPGAIGLPLEEVEGTVVAAWFMGRMSVAHDPPARFILADDLGLESGTKLRILSADYDHKEWADGGTATVFQGGSTESDEGAGIAVFSTVLLVQE